MGRPWPPDNGAPADNDPATHLARGRPVGQARTVRHGRLGWAVAALAAALVGCSSSAAQQTPDHAAPSTVPAGPDAPVVVRDCWVPAGAGNVSLTGEQARALTTRAAELVRTTRDTGRLVQRLAASVRSTAGVDAGTSREVAGALAGLPRAPRLVCAWARAAVEPQQPGPSGLVPRARQLRAAWTEVFGYIPAGGFASGGVHTGHVDGSAHYEGRAMDVFFRPLGDREQHRRGWVFAQWVLAHAADHRVLSIIYDDHIWTSWAAGFGWRDYVHPGATMRHRGTSILRHLDHVHVAVESGRPYRGR
jgi:hypothetical protein